MHGNRYTISAAVAVLIVAILFLIVLLRPSGESDARTLVDNFGTSMQRVSLLAPDASSTIASVYGPYADASLLAVWQANPQLAPGRLTSSPYPDHIEIKSVTPQGSGYIVTGEIVQKTSTGEAGRTPVVIQVVPEDGGYRIVAYQEQRSGAGVQ